MDVKLPRWQADLVAGYTVHEMLHAIWTDFSVVRQASVEKLHGLHNALEDNRIEADASRGKLKSVSEARRLLEALNAHIWQRALNNPMFSMADPKQFSFVLNVLIFAVKLKYKFSFPSDWRARVEQRMLPLYDHALARFDQLKSSMDALVLARELAAMAKALPPAPPQEKPPGKRPCDKPKGEGEDKPGKGKGKALEDKPEDKPEGKGEGEGEAGDDKGEAGDDKPGKGKGEAGEDKPSEGEGEAGEDEGQEGPGKGAKGEDKPGEGKDTGKGEEGPGEAADGPGEAGEDKPPSAPNNGRPANGSSPDGGDVSDTTQEYREANLDDIAGKPRGEHHNASEVINAPGARVTSCTEAGDPADAARIIPSPARLKRHVTLAVKAPERVGYERFQTSGRLDMRNAVAIALHSPNAFRRRIDEAGREAAVTLLVDVSSSMAGNRIMQARALALHMGDALKAAGVKFEIATFSAATGVNMTYPKAMAKPWNMTTRQHVAAMRPTGGTLMLPAIKICGARLEATPHVTRRVMLVLTDGADSYSGEANAMNCNIWRARGVEVFGLGLELGEYDRAGFMQAFAGHGVIVPNARRLSEIGLGELVKLLAEDAPPT
jgi:Mg-chelatase subunit ChlD